jgi:hypothetical protein
VNFPILLLALPICIADLNLFVIPNIYTKLLFYVATLDVVLWGFGSIHQVIISMVALSGLVVLGLGMGDIKLLALIFITHTYPAFEFIGIIFLIAAVHIVVLIVIKRVIPSKIPLAPSIFFGLLTYMATR